MGETLGLWQHWKARGSEAVRDAIRAVGEQLNWTQTWTLRTNVVHMVEQQAIRESYEFVSSHLADAQLFESGPDLQRFAIARAPGEGLVCEFGVFQGASIRRIARALRQAGDPRTVHGFDSFEGLSEDWTGQIGHPKGRFAVGGRLPRVPRNVELVKGWIDDTLDPFLARTEGQRFAFLHLDMDTYGPTKHVLERTRSRCARGTILLFDELYGYPNWQSHEYKALNETYDPDEYAFIGFSTKQCAIRLR